MMLIVCLGFTVDRVSGIFGNLKVHNHSFLNMGLQGPNVNVTVIQLGCTQEGT